MFSNSTSCGLLLTIAVFPLGLIILILLLIIICLFRFKFKQVHIQSSRSINRPSTQEPLQSSSSPMVIKKGRSQVHTVHDTFHKGTSSKQHLQAKPPIPFNIFLVYKTYTQEKDHPGLKNVLEYIGYLFNTENTKTTVHIKVNVIPANMTLIAGYSNDYTPPELPSDEPVDLIIAASFCANCRNNFGSINEARVYNKYKPTGIPFIYLHFRIAETQQTDVTGYINDIKTPHPKSDQYSYLRVPEFEEFVTNINKQYYYMLNVWTYQYDSTFYPGIYNNYQTMKNLVVEKLRSSFDHFKKYLFQNFEQKILKDAGQSRKGGSAS